MQPPHPSSVTFLLPLSLLVLFFSLVRAWNSLCDHCACDPPTEAVTCADKNFVLRTVSLLPYVSQLSLLRIPLIATPHFLYHSGLRVLRINECGLGNISAHAFVPLPNLEVISFSKNQLRHLPVGLFRKQDNLKVVDLSRNKFENLEAMNWMLSENITLDALDISSNPIKQSKKTVALPEARQLLMADTNIEKINNTAIVFKQNFKCQPEGCRILPFPRLERLTYFDVSKNYGMKIESSALQALSNVAHLNLANAVLPDDFFSWLETSAVIYLNISYATLNIPNNEWKYCAERLETLDISGLEIRKLYLHRGCIIRKIYARDNVLEFQTTIFDTPTLETVHIEHSRLTEFPIIPSGTSLDNLETLSLAGNSLTEIPHGTLSHFVSLQHLDLSDNKIKIIEDEAFPSLGMELISIDLSNNQLKKLPIPVLPSLLYLDVSENELNEMSALSFAGMPMLQHLKMGSNKDLFSQCKKTCWADNLDVLTNLIDLDLSACQLNRTIDLSTMTSLKSLYIRGNQLQKLDGSLFPNSLFLLDAGENLIHYVSNFTRLTQLRELFLDGNPLICDCSLYQIQAPLMRRSTLSDSASYYCFSGSWQYPLLSYLTTITPCVNSSESIFLPLSIIGIFLIATFVILLFILSVKRKTTLFNQLSHKYKRLAADFPVKL